MADEKIDRVQGSSPVESGTANILDARNVVARIRSSVVGSELGMPLGLLSLLAVLLLPLPTWLLDLSLSISISLSIVILLTVIFIHRPVELTSFPTILLITTMLRLALNVASTRLILSEGHQGPQAAGRVIEAFGNFVAAGDYVIGLIVFAILVIINFVVITKGSTRIAEVSARFTLDALPGKQMAVDADLSSGLINEDEARARRRGLETESNFYGAMDGAAKFVRGDAIAGILITLINIVGGIIIGVVQRDMELGQAAQLYTLLTVGDGLVTQIPALIVSVGAGMLVTKSGIVGSTERALTGQIGAYPVSLLIASGILFVIGLAPGVPAWPFLLMAFISLGLGQLASRRKEVEEAEAIAPVETEEEQQSTGQETLADLLHVDTIRMELGYGLLAMITEEDGKLANQIRALRRQIAGEMGFVMPVVRIQDNLRLPSNTYIIRVKEIEAGRGDLRPNAFLCMDPKGGHIDFAGEPTIEPTFGLPAMWIAEELREEALMKGHTVVEPQTVITTHLTEIIKDNMAELLSYSETQKLLDEMPESHRRLVSDLIPSQINLGIVQRVLQALLDERVSMRDLPTILEGIGEAVAANTRNMTQIVEHVRARLARQLSSVNAGADGVLPVISLSPKWEQTFAESLVGDGEDRRLALAPSALQEFIEGIRERFEDAGAQGHAPVLLVAPGLRPYMRSLIERFRPTTVVLSQAEVHPKIRIRTTGVI